MTETENVPENEGLAAQFETHRDHLRRVAYRMLGSLSEADDAVQEAWLHLERSDVQGVANLGGWLTTVVARLCLDLLRSRRARHEEALGDVVRKPSEGMDPEEESLLADSVGSALLVVLETLAPPERIAFVLHDLFAVPFEEIAPIVERTPTATRQLASRARRRIQGADPATEASLRRQSEVVAAFFAASRGGDFGALPAVLDPSVVLRADAAAVKAGSAPEVLGAQAVAKTFFRRAQAAARFATVDGVPGAVWAPGGKPRVVVDFTVVAGKIVRIDLLADVELLRSIDVVIAPEGDAPLVS